jgi:FKBP-type peptidyl-prolyl cis-trans isomerase
MTKLGGRVFAGFFAGLFIVTSSALTIGVIWQAVSDHNKNKNQPSQSEIQKALNQAKSKETNVNPGKLQGTQLAGFTPVSHIDQLQKIDTTPGTGDEVKAGDTVTVDYTGAVAATGVIFQSSKDSGQPISFGLSQVIAGWSQGVPGMKVGGTRRLLIPAALAYGANPPQGSGIPANADLVFDITLHKIGQ